MKLAKSLDQHKATIIKKWFNLVVETYPPDTSRFLKSQSDPFANPVGRTTMDGLTALFDGVCRGDGPEQLTRCLDPIIRIRAVQNFTPSQAVGFILSLKSILRGVLPAEFRDDMAVIEQRIDDLGLIGFDVYMQCKEKLYQLKANEQRDRVFNAFQRAGLVTPQDSDSDTPHQPK